MIKVLPSMTNKEIGELSHYNALGYKNKFLEYTLEHNILKLSYYLNPEQRPSNYVSVASKKLIALNKKMKFAQTEVTLLTIEETNNYISTFVYAVDKVTDFKALRQEIEDFTEELRTNDKLSHIFNVNTNKPYAVYLALHEVKDKYKELDNELNYKKYINGGKVYELEIIHNIAFVIQEEK